MAIDVTKTLRQALAALEAEKARISRQIESIQQVLAAGRRAPRQAKRRAGAQGKKKRTAPECRRSQGPEPTHESLLGKTAGPSESPGDRR